MFLSAESTIASLLTISFVIRNFSYSLPISILTLLQLTSHTRRGNHGLYGICFQDAMRALLLHEPDIDRELSASKNKQTALMIAASMGHLDVVRLLIQHGAKAGQSGMHRLLSNYCNTAYI